MKILIIGNGFDIAHGLRTRYTDFLDCAKRFLEYHDDNSLNSEFGKYFADRLRQCGEDFYAEFCELKDNSWLKYLTRRVQTDNVGNTWVDFEREIRKVIGVLERDNSRDCSTWVHRTNSPFSSLLEKLKGLQMSSSPDGMKKYATNVSEFLLNELAQFTRAFEIYCVCIIDRHVMDYEQTHGINGATKAIADKKTEFNRAEARMGLRVEEKKGFITATEKKLHEIETEIYELRANYKNLSLLKPHNFDCVLSFNYTSTFETLYGDERTGFCYIHGKAQDNRTMTNIIFGIDETLGKTEASGNFMFAKFKKYFQRIEKGTGSQYRDWIRDRDSHGNSRGTFPDDICIVGHSMDATDHEILREFFDFAKRNPYVKITIFYHDEASKIKLIQKTIEMIGKDELIRRVHGSDWDIRYVNQYDENDGIFQRWNDIDSPPCRGFCDVLEPLFCKWCKIKHSDS